MGELQRQFMLLILKMMICFLESGDGLDEKTSHYFVEDMKGLIDLIKDVKTY